MCVMEIYIAIYFSNIAIFGLLAVKSIKMCAATAAHKESRKKRKRKREKERERERKRERGRERECVCVCLAGQGAGQTGRGGKRRGDVKGKRRVRRANGGCRRKRGIPTHTVIYTQ